MFAAIAAEDRYRFDLKAKRMHSLCWPAAAGNISWRLTCCPDRCHHHPDAVGWLMDSLLAAGLTG